MAEADWMTEADWLAHTFPESLLRFLGAKASDRKLLLFAVGFWDLWWGILEDEESRNGVRALEALAEGEQPENNPRHLYENGDWAIIFGGNYMSLHQVGPGHAADVASWLIRSVEDTDWRLRGDPGHEACGKTQLTLVRDIFNNPFRPVTFSPSWRTSTTVVLAAQMYDSRDFSAMPILADALQDAGCDHSGVLDHGRGPGPHVRGCWVVDLVLGKE